MFCYQKSFANPTLPVDEAQFNALVRAEQWNENIDKYRETHDAALKRKLPAFIFQATFDETESKAGKVGRWRKQSATRLTGLVVMDVDHIEEPKAVFEGWGETELRNHGVLLVYITPSGKGLKIVFKARHDWGNLIDNQHAMAKVLGVEVDESCKDASRMSFICKETDIMYLDKELFTYEDKKYAERYDAVYRNGSSQATKKILTNTNLTNLTNNEALKNSSDSCNSCSAKRGRPRKVAPQALETATEQCCKWLSTLGISATISPTWSLGHLRSADLYRTSSESEGKKRSGELLIRLVSEECTKTSPSECRRCLRVQVYYQAKPQEMSELWTRLTSLMSSTLKGWNLSLALLMPKPVVE